MSSPAQLTGTIPDILITAETGKAEDLHADLRALSDSSLYYFAKVVMNYRDLTEGFHLPFCLRIQEDEERTMNGYLLSRGTFKSTIRTKSYMLWKYLHNHEERFLNVGESDTVAKKALIDIKWHVLNNDLLRWLYPELKLVDPQSVKWTDSEILLPREGTYDEPTITCDGVGAKRTGFHYTEIIFDDIIGDKAAASEAVMDATWEWVQYSRGLLHEAAKSRRTFVGTRWKHGIGDIYGRIMETMPDCKWYIRAAIEEDKPTFPERLSIKTLAGIRDEQGDYKYNCQYMNDPTFPGSTDFEAGWLQEYEVADDGVTIIPCDGTSSFKTGHLLRMSFYDVSSGGISANCENALAFGGMTSDKRIIVLEDWAKNCTIGQAVEQWHVMNDRWNCYHNHYENVGAQKAIEDFCRERKNQKQCPYCNAGHLDKDGKLYIKNPHRKINPIGIKPEGGSMNKEDRIRLYSQKACEEKRVYFRRGLMTALRKQIIQFPHAPMVDRFDALAYLIKLLRPPISDNELESDEAARSKARLAGKPRTQVSRDYGGY